MTTGPVRRPSVAGQFYQGAADALRREIEGCFLHRLGPGSLPQVDEAGPRRTVGLACPHAGYFFSGAPAAKGYHALAADGRPKHIVVIGPSHRAWGTVAVTQTSGAWRTPLGDVPIDTDLAQAIVSASDAVADEASALSDEHSLEVQVPFLQYVYGESLTFVPVMMFEQSAERAAAVGRALAQALEGLDAVIVASTDMTHYMSAEEAKRRDQTLIDRMLELDAEGLCERASRRDMSMCGYGPVGAMLTAARILGATGAEVLAYSTSGDVQRMADVVAYLSLAVTR
jgi:AmmeMemoRadiSam system protein B